MVVWLVVVIVVQQQDTIRVFLGSQVIHFGLLGLLGIYVTNKQKFKNGLNVTADFHRK